MPASLMSRLSIGNPSCRARVGRRAPRLSVRARRKSPLEAPPGSLSAHAASRHSRRPPALCPRTPQVATRGAPRLSVSVRVGTRRRKSPLEACRAGRCNPSPASSAQLSTSWAESCAERGAARQASSQGLPWRRVARVCGIRAAGLLLRRPSAAWRKAGRSSKSHNRKGVA